MTDEESAAKTEESQLLPVDDAQQPIRKSCFQWFLRIVGTLIIGCGKVDWNFDGPDQGLKKFTEALKDGVGHKESDIYVVTSILRCPRYRKYAEADHSSPCCSYQVWKCLLCAFLQIVVTPLVATDQIWSTFVEQGVVVCQTESDMDDMVGKIVAFAFSAYIWVLYLKEQQNNNHPDNAANYLLLECRKVPTTVHCQIFVYGYIANTSSQLITSFAAVVLIFCSSSAMNIILNSLALFFLNDIDDYLATTTEYKRARLLLEQAEADEASEKVSIEHGHLGMQDVGLTVFKLFGALGSMFVVMSLGVAPFLMLACYGTVGKDD